MHDVNIQTVIALIKKYAGGGGGGEVTPQKLAQLIQGDNDINADLNAAATKLVISSAAQKVFITGVPTTATSGTLTEEQLAALQESEKSVLVFNNEIYFLNDSGHEAGILGYSHLGVENSAFMLKNISVTISTRGWVLTTSGVEASAVTSVNGETGDVVLGAGDILATNSQSVQANLERIDDDVADANDAIDTLETRVDNLQNIGRFLAIWNATTGVPTSEPPESPYTYRTGDYFRIGVVGDRIPDGATYTTGGVNYTTTTDTLAIGDIYYYDGTVWRRQASTGGGAVQDIQLAGTSILSGGIANIPEATSSALGVVEKAAGIGSTETGVVSGSQVYNRLGGLTLVSLTQAEYDALTTKDASTLYVIKAA